MPRILSSRGLTAIFLIVIALVGTLAALAAERLLAAGPIRASGTLELDAGFSDWAFCAHEQRVETHPGQFWAADWGPAVILGATGCGCSGDATFSGNPETAGTGFGIAPPNDIAGGDVGQLAPDGRDHPFVLAHTGEVVYTETDFVIPGIGFDFQWTRTWRSALDYTREFGQGWTHSADLALVESTSGTVVESYLGDGRVEDEYTWDAVNEVWDSPAGYYDQLVKTVPQSGEPYFIKTEKNGVEWKFLRTVDATKDLYSCVYIKDLYGNQIDFNYDNGTYPDVLTSIDDTEGRTVTITRNGSLQITKVDVNSTAIGDYGNLAIDYTYTSGNLTKVEKHYTRTVDAGTKQRPYTEYTYLTSGVPDKDIDLVKDCGTTVLNFDYHATSGRCTKVTGADSETHDYAYDVSSTNHSVTKDVTRYTDPYGQKQEFIYADLSGGDRTIVERWDFLEDKVRADITDAAVTKFTRDCDCGRITKIVYHDTSEERWEYDSYGSVTKYKRVSSDTLDTDLVKAWTYATFANYSRMLTSSGWLRKEANPASKVTWTWNTDGTLQKVAHPAATSGQPSSQTIEWTYTWRDPGGGTDGRLETATDPAAQKVKYTYSGDTITRTDDPDTGGLQLAYKTVRNVFGTTTQTEDPSGVTSQWDYTVTPDGRVLKVEGPNSQETKYTYDLRGRKTKDDVLLEDSPSTRVETSYTYSSGSHLDEVKADSATGGIQATTTYTLDETNRFNKVVDPDSYGSKNEIGYGSHNLPWKNHNVDATGQSEVLVRTMTYERDTMGRVTAQVALGGTRTEFTYDGYGRLEKTSIDIGGSKDRETVRTLKDWGAPDKIEVQVVGGGTTKYAITKYHYDEAVRNWKVVREDPEATLSDRVTKYVRDANGRTATRTDARVKDWKTEWDDVGRVTKTIDPIGNEMRYAYNDTTARTRTITSHEYDTKAASFTDFVKVETKDASRRVTSVKNEGSSSGNRTTSYTYDEGGRQLKMTAPESQETNWEYDKLGRMTKDTVNIDGATTQAITTYTYTDGGKRTRVADANAINTDWTYDSFGRQLTVKYNNVTAQTYTTVYDSYGPVNTVTDPEGVVKDYTYDTALQVTQLDITIPGESALVGPVRIVYTLDDMGRITTAKTQSKSGEVYSDIVTVTRAYNGFGEMKSETQHGSRTVAYTFDDGGKITEILYPTGGPVVGVQYTYDDNGRVDLAKRKLSTDVEGVSTSVWETCAEFEYQGYREHERKQTVYDLNRVQTYTSFQEPLELTYKEISTSILITGLDYEWDAAGRMVVRERMHDEAGGTQYGEVFRYDDMNRLTKFWRDIESPNSWDSTDPTESTAVYQDWVSHDIGKVYERDGVSVRPDGGGPTSTTAVTVDNLYQSTAFGSDNLSWDLNGQLTDYAADDYTWTALGQLAKADPTGVTARDYTYDAFGRRVKTKVGSQENEFLYHGWHMIGEYDKTATEWLWHEVPMVRGERMLEHVALDTNDLDDDQDTDEYRPYAVHEDFQSTVWGLSEADGDLAERYLYSDPYGVSLSEDGAGGSLGAYSTDVFHRKRLHGGFVEEASELYDFRNRWHRPEMGVWMSRDPFGYVDSYNLYSTFGSAPNSLRDPNGTCLEHDQKTDYGNLRTKACRTPGEAKDFPGKCKGKAGCTSLGCWKVKEKGTINCQIEIKVDCEHPDVVSGKYSCGDVANHEILHMHFIKKCIDKKAGELKGKIDNGEFENSDGTLDLDAINEELKKIVEYCGESPEDWVHKWERARR